MEDVLWRILSTMKDAQCCKGCSVLLRMLSTVEDAQYYGGCSVLLGMFTTAVSLEIAIYERLESLMLAIKTYNLETRFD